VLYPPGIGITPREFLDDGDESRKTLDHAPVVKI
jgi:hypothetical protein